MLWRAANRVGKTRGQAKKLIHFLRGTGPYADRRPGPVRVLVMTISKEQQVALHEMIWQLLPKDEIDKAVKYVPGFGFRGKPPRVTFTSGPAKGSVVTFATYRQGSERIAGFNFDVVLLDEPPPESLWGEVQGRVVHGNPGEIWISFTATPDSPDLKYLRKKVEDGDVVEQQTSLTVDAVTLTSGRALITQERIDEFASGLLELERDMRLHGGWDIIVTDRLLTNFGPHCVHRVGLVGGALLAVGIDHGAGAGKQAAALIMVQDPTGPAPRITVLEESIADGFTTPDQDAAAILAMLARRGVSFDDVDLWIGDRPSGMNRYDVRKSNAELRRQLARLLSRDTATLPNIEVPYKWDGSVTNGCRLLNAAMGRKDESGASHFLVDPACEKLVDAISRWKGAKADKLKDIIDAVRYPAEKLCKAGQGISFQLQYA